MDIVKGEGGMFRKLALVWVIVVLPLASILSGCGEEETAGGLTGETEEEFTAEWNITLQTSGVEATLQEVFFDSNTGQGWIVGNDGIILHTTDKGATWEKQESGVAGVLHSVSFVNESEGWAVGDSGTVIHTEDGGATWETQNTGVTEQLRSVFFANNSEGWAVGEGGVIIETKDGGLGWEPQDSGTNQTLEAIDFAPPKPGEVVIDRGWVVGVNGTIIHTSTGGRGTGNRRGWMPQLSKGVTDRAVPLYGVYFPDDDKKGWIVGKQGTILRTSDSGQTWGSSAAASAGGKSLYDVFFTNAADGWCVGSGGKLLHSPDGRTWDEVKTETTKDITKPLWGVAFIDSSEGWVVGDAGVILHIEKIQ
jgi:photosystem II stability/assembly factor-like uncharacterized protein